MTHVLSSQLYWPSYNTLYFEKLFNISNDWSDVYEYGSWFTYNHTARANIFRRNQTMVKDLESMKALMRYNNFQHDPLSRCNCTPPYSGENAISARSDLNPANGTYPFDALGHRAHGGIDCKVTSYALFSNFSVHAISGPTYDQQPVFQWSTSGLNYPHYGQPDRWEFDWVAISFNDSNSTRSM